MKVESLEASVTRKYDKCHKNSVQNKQDTLYNKIWGGKESIVISFKVIANLNYNIN